MKNIGILGSGLVSGSVVNFFYRNRNEFLISVGSKVRDELETLQKAYPEIAVIELDVTKDIEKLNQMVKGSDVIISLLTNDMHVPIAEVCIQHGTSMVHASYCTEEMLQLDTAAKQNGVTILNEIGLDPGIDHFLAKRAVDEIIHENSKVISFVSYCGGLPEPKISRNNPLRYKFTWSPITALGNLLNSAKFLENNEVVEIPSGGALLDEIRDVEFHADLQLEGYPNRNSLMYKDLYGISEATDVLRGTLRYRGFGSTVKTLQKLKLLGSESLCNDGRPIPKSWNELMLQILSEQNRTDKNYACVKTALHDRGFEETEISAITELGLLSNKPDLNLRETLLHTLAQHLAIKLSFEPKERDIVIMWHKITCKKSNGDIEVREIDFIEHGDQHIDGFSAMSKTVGLTIGHATKLLLNKTLNKTGVIYPFTPDIYNPILKQLELEGLYFNEKKYTHFPG